jgi:WD40 repeat protein
VTGQPVRFANPGAVPNVATALRSDGSLVSVGTNGTVYVWDMTARQVTSQLAAPRGADFERAAISPDGDTTAVQASGGTAYILRGEASPAGTLPAGDHLYPGSIATAGLTIATGNAAGTGVDVWTDAGFSSTPAVTLTNPDGGAAITSVSLSVDAAIVAASDDSGRTYLWNANNGTRTHLLRPPDGSAAACSVFAFGGGVLATHLLVTGNRDGRAYLWNADTGALVRCSGPARSRPAAAGMTAALTAAKLGLSVVVLEKASVFGGSLARSGSGVWIPNNSVVLAAGVPDTPALAAECRRHPSLSPT